MQVTSAARVAQDATQATLLDVTGHLHPITEGYYIDHPFTVPKGSSRVGLTLTFHKERLAQIFVSLHDPNGFRGNRMQPQGKGDIRLDLWVAPDQASPGGVIGSLHEGQWRAQLQIERIGEETDYHLTAYAEMGTAQEALDFVYPSGHVTKPVAGWYHGELHCHSTESDGKYPVQDMVRIAQDFGLDFLALTDHFTTSQWNKMAAFIDAPIALIRSCEITSRLGHANLHGIQLWVNVFVDRPGWSMNEAARDAHAQGGLFCVNHAFNLDLGWRDENFDWDLADLLEVYHNLEGPHNNYLGSLWDHHLQLGRRIVGVGGTDSHDPYFGVDTLGQVVTWVNAPELSERGIVHGLRRGQVYISRGPELRFTAHNERGDHAEMWESLPADDGVITFQLQAKNAEPLNVVVLKNGYPFRRLPIKASPDAWQTIEFSDKPTKPAYYRVELHRIFEDKETYIGIDWRDYTTIQALTNPIWVGTDLTSPVE